MKASAILLSVLISCVYSTPFRTVLNIPPQVKLGEDVICQVTISNPTNDDYFLFDRATPLENVISDIFSINMNGSNVLFDGRLFKRAAVNKESKGIKIKAQASISMSVDLSSAYPLSKRSTYTASLSSRIYFLKIGDSTISHGQLLSAPVRFTLHGEELGKKTLGENHREESKEEFVEVTGSPINVNFNGIGDSVDKSYANKAWLNAYEGVVRGQAAMISNPSEYTYWFGVSPSNTPSPWKNTLSTLQSNMENKQFTLYFHGPDCEDNVFAYTYYQSKTLYLCDEYFFAQDTGYNSKFGTIVHEMTHAVMNTKDLAYGTYECRRLAPSKAIQNADNYEFYVESLP